MYERNNETASSLRFNKPESANFIFDCVQYFIPKEGRSRLLRTSASVAFPPPGALGGSQQMRECTGLHANPPWLDIDFFPSSLPEQQKISAVLFHIHSKTLEC